MALVVLNQVERAQQVYEKLADHFPGEVILLHGRLCAAHRAERTQRCLNALGPNAGDARPHRMIIVATQLAEQSFDVDADLLVTDLALIDLLLQRIGLPTDTHVPADRPIFGHRLFWSPESPEIRPPGTGMSPASSARPSASTAPTGCCAPPPSSPARRGRPGWTRTPGGGEKSRGMVDP